MTDNAKIYRRIDGYDRGSVTHAKKQYVNGPVHINNVEAFFSHVKRSVTGVHKTISKKHSQAYLNGFAFHWNNQHSDKERFALLLGTVLRGAK